MDPALSGGIADSLVRQYGLLWQWHCMCDALCAHRRGGRSGRPPKTRGGVDRQAPLSLGVKGLGV